MTNATAYRRQTRDSWGATPPRGRRFDVGLVGVAIHWPGPGSTVKATHAQCEDLARQWQAQHMARNSLDLEYGALMCHGHGGPPIVMEARTETTAPTTRVGSNGTAAANYSHSSIQLMRAEADPPPPDAEIAALGAYVAWMRRQGFGDSVEPHSRFYATACPGPYLTAALPAIRAAADNPPAPTPTPEDEDMPIIVSQGSRHRLISAGLVVKVDNPAPFVAAGLDRVPVTAADMDRITAAPSRVRVLDLPAIAGAAALGGLAGYVVAATSARRG